jgi:hypothetical protein
VEEHLSDYSDAAEDAASAIVIRGLREIKNSNILTGSTSSEFGNMYFRELEKLGICE